MVNTYCEKIIRILLRLSTGVIIWPVLFSLIVTSCDKNPAEVSLKYDYSLYAYLIVGESIDTDKPIMIKQLLDPYKPLKDQEIGVTNAKVTIYTVDKPERVFNLVHDANGNYISLTSDSLIIRPNTTYKIQVEIDQHIITAETVTPPLTVFRNELMSADSLHMPDADLQLLREHPLKVSCNPGEQRIVYIETYCLEEYSNARFIYKYFGSDYPKDQEQYESPTGGFPRRLVAVGVYSSRVNIDPENILITDYDSMFFFYGRNRLMVYVIDENYYQSIYMTKGWEKGGVTGAYGVFGSGMGSAFYVNIGE